MVISRGYAVCVLVIFTALSMYYVYLRPSYSTHLTPYEVPKESKPIPYSWEEFLNDCGGTVIVENNVHARNIFNQKYESNVVTWKGFFAESKVAQGIVPFIGSSHHMNFLIKMSPSESPLYPDLVLSISSRQWNEKK